MQPNLTTPSQETIVRTKATAPCTHNRLVDEVLSANGAKTGRLLCMECQAEFPDPLYHTNT